MKNRSIPVMIGAAALALALIPVGSHAFQQTATPQPAAAPGGRAPLTPEQLAAQQATQQASKDDRQQMMDLLHIASLRPPVNARTLGSANYDEAKANPYRDLPDPLVMKNGKKVTSAKMWWDQRRPEIVEDFDREIYGRLPSPFRK